MKTIDVRALSNNWTYRCVKIEMNDLQPQSAQKWKSNDTYTSNSHL